jgi:hypothetical protein
MAGERRFKLAIPDGYRRYENLFEVPFAKEYVHNIESLRGSSKESYALEPEPTNSVDPNAMLIVVVRKGFFGSRSEVLGYLPRGIAKYVSEMGIAKTLIPRPQSLWIGDRGGVSFGMDLLGPKPLYKSYIARREEEQALRLAEASSKPPSDIQKAYFKFFGMELHRGITSALAAERIQAHEELMAKAGDERKRMWDAFAYHWDELSDRDVRDDYEIKKPGLGLAMKVFKDWINDDDFALDDVEATEEFVDRLLAEKPSLGRQAS